VDGWMKEATKLIMYTLQKMHSVTSDIAKRSLRY